LHLQGTLRCATMDTDFTMVDLKFLKDNLQFSVAIEEEIRCGLMTDDGERVLRIVNGLKRNYEKYGAPYCPCKVDKVPDNICPCKDHIERGTCICGLFKRD
jgi:ferredoxin-thioredoxin reductase catalytic subunit